MLKWALLLMMAAAEPVAEPASVRSGFARIRGRVMAVDYIVRPEDPDDPDGPGSMCFIEGDIAIGTLAEVEQITDDQRQRAVGRTGEEWRWPNGRIPYLVAADLPEPRRVKQAVDAVNSKTVLRMVPRTDEANYVEFVSRGGCWSYVGMQGGRQEISIAAGCGVGNTKHEIFHAAGMWHEQSRYDRDRYVIIHWDNIVPGRESNFAKHDTDGDDLGPYDPGSITHYGRTFFSKNGLATIEPIEAGTIIGQRFALSIGDILGVEILYGAEPKKREFVTVTVLGALEAKTVEKGQPAIWTKDFPRAWRVQWQPSYLDPLPEKPPTIIWHVQTIPHGKRYTRWILTAASGDGTVRIKPLSTITKRKRADE